MRLYYSVVSFFQIYKSISISKLMLNLFKGICLCNLNMIKCLFASLIEYHEAELKSITRGKHSHGLSVENSCGHLLEFCQ